MAIDATASTRDRLLAATVECLRADGLDGLTSREITRRAGANLQAITYHFESKDALVAAALTELVEQRLAPVRAALDADGTPVERLGAALGAIRGAFPDHRAELRTYADALAVGATNPALSAALGALHDDLVGYLAQLVAEMKADGFVAAWVEPRAMAALLVALGDGLTVQASFGDPDVGGVLGQLSRLLLGAGGGSAGRAAGEAPDVDQVGALD